MNAWPQAVAWDVDGTLIDSEPMHLHALLEVCRAHAVDLSEFGETPFVGVAAHVVWQTLAPRFGAALGRDPAARERAFFAAIDEHYDAHVHTLEPMPGAMEAVDLLHERGVPMAAVSNSRRRVVLANLRRLGVESRLRFAISIDDVEHPKPHPAPYREAARRLGVEPSQVWAVEDSASGTASARAAGLRVLLVAGLGTTPEAAAHAHLSLPSLHAWMAQWARGEACTGSTR